MGGKMSKLSDKRADDQEQSGDESKSNFEAGNNWVREIGPTSRRPDQIAVLQDVVKLKLKEIAYAACVSRETVRLWKHSDNGERPERYEDLRAVTERLLRAETLDPILIGAWFRSRNRGLQDRRPLEAIRAGAFEKVSEAAESFIALSAAAPEHVTSGEQTPVLERPDVVKAITGAGP
jgi:hypothetical protein